MFEFRGWGSAVLGAALGSVMAFASFAHTGSHYSWLMIPVVFFLIAFGGEPGPPVD